MRKRNAIRGHKQVVTNSHQGARIKKRHAVYAAVANLFLTTAWNYLTLVAPD